MKRRLSNDRLLARTGGRYILIALVAAQVISLLGAIPGILSIRVNTEFNQAQLQVFSKFIPLDNYSFIKFHSYENMLLF